MAGGCVYQPSPRLAGVINSIRLFTDTPLRVAPDGSAKDTPLPTSSAKMQYVSTHTCTQYVASMMVSGWRYVHVRYFFIPFTFSQASYRLLFLLRSIIIQRNMKQDKNLWCRVISLIFFRKKVEVLVAYWSNLKRIQLLCHQFKIHFQIQKRILFLNNFEKNSICIWIRNWWHTIEFFVLSGLLVLHIKICYTLKIFCTCVKTDSICLCWIFYLFYLFVLSDNEVDNVLLNLY